MTNKEMLQTLIHIKRHIRSKPIKKFIDSKIACIKLTQSNYSLAAGSYQVTYDMPLYGQKIALKIDERI